MLCIFTACSQTRILIYPRGSQRDRTEIHDLARVVDSTTEQATDVQRRASQASDRHEVETEGPLSCLRDVIGSAESSVLDWHSDRRCTPVGAWNRRVGILCH